jgi:hypothetical protein
MLFLRRWLWTARAGRSVKGSQPSFRLLLALSPCHSDEIKDAPGHHEHDASCYNTLLGTALVSASLLRASETLQAAICNTARKRPNRAFPDTKEKEKTLRSIGSYPKPAARVGKVMGECAAIASRHEHPWGAIPSPHRLLPRSDTNKGEPPLHIINRNLQNIYLVYTLETCSEAGTTRSLSAAFC